MLPWSLQAFALTWSYPIKWVKPSFLAQSNLQPLPSSVMTIIWKGLYFWGVPSVFGNTPNQSHMPPHFSYQFLKVLRRSMEAASQPQNWWTGTGKPLSSLFLPIYFWCWDIKTLIFLELKVLAFPFSLWPLRCPYPIFKTPKLSKYLVYFLLSLLPACSLCLPSSIPTAAWFIWGCENRIPRPP